MSKLFIPPRSFLASANACAVLFVFMNWDVKPMSTFNNMEVNYYTPC